MESTSRPPAVYLDVANSEFRSRWALRLAEAGFSCIEPMASSSSPQAFELLVADHALAEPTIETAFEPVAEHGTILVGPAEVAVGAGPVDVHLPADCTDRELVLACRLLLEVVRLRGERQHEMQTRNALLRLALTDTLTGLANRRAWHEALHMRWAAVRGTRVTLCLAILDLDEFKPLNDAFGHAAGDRALEIAGEALAAEVRRDDFVARLGGDEFGLLLVGVDPESTAAVVERVRARLSERMSAELASPLTASAGFAMATDPQLPDSQCLLQAADQALRAAKRLGRNRTVAASALGCVDGQHFQPGAVAEFVRIPSAADCPEEAPAS